MKETVPHRSEFPEGSEGNVAYQTAYLSYLALAYNLEPGDRILTTVNACFNNQARWEKGSDRARGG